MGNQVPVSFFRNPMLLLILLLLVCYAEYALPRTPDAQQAHFALVLCLLPIAFSISGPLQALLAAGILLIAYAVNANRTWR